MRRSKKYRFTKVFIWIVYIVLFNIIAFFVVANIPAVQTRFAQYLSRVLSSTTGFIITIKDVDIKWIDTIKLNGLKIIDNKNEEFLDVESLEVNYSLAKILKEDINLDKAEIQGLNMRLNKAEGDTLNISILINRLKKLSKNNGSKSSKVLSISEVYIANSKFKYDQGQKSSPNEQFDPKHFSLIGLNARLSSLVIVADTIMLNIKELSVEEEYIGAKVHKLETDFLISPRTMRFDSLTANFGRSKITKNIVFNYNSYSSLQYFNDSVSLDANLDRAKIYAEDLKYFVPYFNSLRDTYTLSGNVTGEVADLKIRNLDLSLGKGSNISGSLYLSGLPEIQETFMDIKLKNSTIFEDDIEKYVRSKSFSEYNRFRRLKVNGSFTGYVQDFVAFGKIETNHGTIISDINLKLAPNTAQTSYSGKIQLIGFDLGSYLEESMLGRITLKGNIRGRGLKQKEADINFNGSIDSLNLNKYTYSNIKTNGQFKEEFFSGKLIIDDPNLKLSTENTIDLRNSRNEIKVAGELEYAQLDALNLIENHTIIRSKIEADFKGFVLDSIIGNLYLEDLYTEYLDRKLEIKHLTLNSLKENNQRSLELITERANINVSGDFYFTSAIKDISGMAKEYILSLQNNADSIESYYASNITRTDKPYSITLKARLKGVDRFLNLFEPGLSLHQGTSLDVFYNHSRTSTISLQLRSDSITFNGNTIIDNKLNLDASKVIGEPKILASLDVQSVEQILSNGAQLDDLLISAIWNNNKIDFNWYHTQKKLNSVNDIYGEVQFYKDSTEVHLTRSNLSLLDHAWKIQDNNSIVITNQEIAISNLNLSSDDQMLTVSGLITEDPNKALAITANNLDVGLINPLLAKQISGRVSGEFVIANMYHTPTIVSNFYIKEFAIGKYLVGDIFSSNDWNSNLEQFDIQFIVNRDGTPMIMVDGIFNPFDSKNALDLNATFRNARLAIAEPFIETIFSDIQGGITGNIHIIGPLRSPIISGTGSFVEAGLTVNYLNTKYSVDGEWAFDSTAIYLNKILLTDANNRNATLDGNFSHKNYKKFNINLQGSMDRFLVLNTTANNNDLFYGNGIASGRVSFTGPIEDITIKAQAKTERGTKFYIPIGGSTTTDLEDYISFVDFSDTLNNIGINQEQEVKIRGLNLEFDLEITEDAYTEIIFDITSGDIIRGRGNGNLSLNIDTKGEFTMIGGYEFVEGGYNFTMYNIVNKEFTINPKSTITWSGDPYSGVMNIDAAYKLSTKLTDLVDTAYHDMPDLQRLYPAEVLLGLNGPLLNPDIKFQIIIDDYPKSNADLDTQVKAFLNTIALDQQELNRQVFSLLILRKFSPPNSFSSSGSIGSSVSEFVANQLSYWISQVDDNLTIDMDLGELDEDALKTFQLRVSYAFMDGKLIVTRDGGFTDPNNNVATASSIAGDWTLEYLLTEDGKLRVKLFNKTNYNQLNSATGSDSQSLLTGGFSLIYTISFNKFGELVKKNKKQKKEKEVNTEPSTSALKPEEYRHK